MHQESESETSPIVRSARSAHFRSRCTTPLLCRWAIPCAASKRSLRSWRYVMLAATSMRLCLLLLAPVPEEVALARRLVPVVPLPTFERLQLCLRCSLAAAAAMPCCRKRRSDPPETYSIT